MATPAFSASEFASARQKRRTLNHEKIVIHARLRRKKNRKAVVLPNDGRWATRKSGKVMRARGGPRPCPLSSLDSKRASSWLRRRSSNAKDSNFKQSFPDKLSNTLKNPNSATAHLGRIKFQCSSPRCGLASDYFRQFRVDLPHPPCGPVLANTQGYEDFLDDRDKFGLSENDFDGEEASAPIGWVLYVTRNTITLAVEASLEDDWSSQKERNYVYRTAAAAHRTLQGACVTYYRGTDSLHIKRQHITVEEAAHNHNHYRFNTVVAPPLFGEFLANFVQIDSNSTHGGTSAVGQPKYLSAQAAEEITQNYTACFDGMSQPQSEEHARGLELECDSFYWFTEEDLMEWQYGSRIEDAQCDHGKPLEVSMTGLHGSAAEERLHHWVSPEVKRAREVYRTRMNWLKQIRSQRKRIAMSNKRIGKESLWVD